MGNITYHESNRMLGPASTVAIVLLMVFIECLAVLCYTGRLSIDEIDSVGLAVVTLIVLAVIAMAFLLRLDVTVTATELRIRTVRTRVIPRDSITSATIRTDVDAVHEYGGYGIRIWLRGTGYTIHGMDGGVEVETANSGRRIFIASRDPGSLASALA